MGKTLVVYYSLGQSTYKVAGAVSSGLASEGCEIVLWDLSDGIPPSVDEFTSLGLAFPVHYFRPARAMIDFLKSLPPILGMPFFLIVLYGTLPGDSALKAAEILERKGAHCLGVFHAKGRDLFLGYLKLGYLFSPENPSAVEFAGAAEFGKIIATALSTGKCDDIAFPGPPPFVYRLERFLTGPYFISCIYSRLFHLNRKKCIACGLCDKTCPTGNITRDPTGRPIWGRDCLLCLSCEMRCPADAITSPVSLPLFAPFMRYNTRSAAKNPNLTFARVTLEKGKLTRLTKC